MKELGQPAYRAVQIFEWLHQRFPNADGEAFSFAEMSNLPKDLRAALEKCCNISPMDIKEELRAKDGTVKFLLTMGDGLLIESVLMEYAHGHSVCVSTQAGCRMGCVFCATGQSGLLRDLTAGEMCMQVYAAGSGGKIRNVVLMGCGEPLDNFDACVRFIELITHPKGAGLSQRHITLSTCGLVPEIHALAQLRMQITLAVSLHGPDDTTRQTLMPVAKAYPIKELLTACREYADITRRRISFEYALTEGVNDSPTQARMLAKQLKGLLCHVNLIPVNPVASASLSPTKKREAQAFAEILQEASIPTTIRRTIGAEVDAACGQLRARRLP